MEFNSGFKGLTYEMGSRTAGHVGTGIVSLHSDTCEHAGTHSGDYTPSLPHSSVPWCGVTFLEQRLIDPL